MAKLGLVNTDNSSILGDGTPGKPLRTNSSAIPAPGGAGADKQVIFNDAGKLNGNARFTFDKVTGAFRVNDAIPSTGTVNLSSGPTAFNFVGIDPTGVFIGGTETGGIVSIQGDASVSIESFSGFVQLGDLNGIAVVKVNSNGFLGFRNAVPIAKPAVVGAKAANAALASLLTALANYGLITDNTTA